MKFWLNSGKLLRIPSHIPKRNNSSCEIETEDKECKKEQNKTYCHSCTGVSQEKYKVQRWWCGASQKIITKSKVANAAIVSND